MKFLNAVVLSTITCSVLGSSCINDQANRVGQTATITQTQNGNVNKTILTGGVAGTITFGSNNCVLSIPNFQMTISTTSQDDPKMRWYGKTNPDNTAEYGFPVTDQYIAFNLTATPSSGGFQGAALSAQSYPFTRNGAMVGGVAISDIRQFLLYSETYMSSFAIANCATCVSGGVSGGGNSTTSTPQKSAGFASMSDVLPWFSTLILAFFV